MLLAKEIHGFLRGVAVRMEEKKGMLGAHQEEGGGNPGWGRRGLVRSGWKIVRPWS